MGIGKDGDGVTLYEGNSINALGGRLSGLLLSNTRPVPRTLFVATADKAVTNTTTETTLFGTGIGSLTLPAAATEADPVTTVPFWYIGKTLRVTMRGYMNKGSTSTTRKYTLYIGGSSVITKTTAAGTTALSNDGWVIDILLTCRTTGATGTLYAQGKVDHESISNAWLIGTSTFTFDTTADNALDVQFKWSATDASHSIVTTDAVVEALN